MYFGQGRDACIPEQLLAGVWSRRELPQSHRLLFPTGSHIDSIIISHKLLNGLVTVE